MFEFYIFCDAEGKCVLKQKDAEATRKFTDILDAMNYLHALNVGRGSKLTVYDPLGNVTFENSL